MLQLTDIRKSYTTGDFTQTALDGVSITFRDNEFAAILGTSGSGKTTMLNIIGGLDHYDSGDLVIDGVSTKEYTDRDWDTYRNHRVGFIFQSYNLIPHQTILSNVELALTLTGVDRAERRKRAADALVRVGLGDHMNKKPNQLSGGQMQRVAIARALVNDPEIVLADEPTGALDTETGIQVMNLLKEIASDRLVVMVTHNPELAHQYATRIVNLKDGHILGDSDPVEPGETGTHAQAAQTAQGFEPKPAVYAPSAGEQPGASAGADAGAGAGKRQKSAKPDRKASMSFLTALSLSFNNLMTKKGRTALTAFAGSIGIIGIAAILALSNGVNNYIADTEEEALTSYPLTITKSSFDFTALMGGMSGYATGDDADNVDKNAERSVDSNIPESTIMSDMFAKVKNNDLAAFKDYLENGDSDIDQYVHTIQYNYGVEPQIYMSDTGKYGVQQLNPSSMAAVFQNGVSTSSLASGSSSMSSFQEMLDNRDILEQQMDVVEGRWPENYDEAVLVLSKAGSISDYTLYSLGVYDPDDMKDMLTDALSGKEVTVPEVSRDFTYSDALNLTFSVVPASEQYQYNAEQGTWTDMSKDSDYMKERVDNGIKLKIVGVVRPSETATSSALTEGVAYTPELIDHLIDQAQDSDIVKQQLENSDVDVFTGKTFEELQDDQESEFDMSSMFSVDEDALKNAFSFDTSALSGSGVNLDLSGIDTSSLASGADMDMSSMDTSALSKTFNAETMAAIMKGAPKFDMSNMDFEMSAAQQETLAKAQSQMMTDFMAYALANQSKYFDPTSKQIDFATAYTDFLATDQGKADQAAVQAASMGAYQDAIEAAMSDYMTNQFAPYLSQQMTALMTQAAQTMATSMAQQMATQMQAATNQLGTQLSQSISSQLSSQMSSLSDSLASSFSFDADAFANAIQFNMSQEDLTSLLTNYMNSDELTYDNNLTKLGYADKASPETISIYPIDFPAKEKVLDIIDGYNDKMSAAGNDEATIQYTDFVGTLMSSVTSIVNTISVVLIAFVAISLVVSSIMIAIITYISVLERRKEIGILRAMGASKLNIANIFNAETIIEGFISGVFAIALVYLASIPVNAIVLAGFDVPNVMSLPISAALGLIAISVILTFVAGLIPSSMASRRDPVEALRSE